jgi:hypothetical protein
MMLWDLQAREEEMPEKLTLKPIEEALIAIRKDLEEQIKGATGAQKKKWQSQLKKLNRLIIQVRVPCKGTSHTLGR